MKYIKVGLWMFYAWAMFFLGLVLAVPVQAQTTTPTVTRTPYPTFLPTATAIGYNFPTAFACPAGNPVGYGTVTPDLFWESACGQCLHTPYPTSTIQPTVTSTGTPPTPTRTPTATATSTGRVYISCMPSYVGVSCDDLQTNVVRIYPDVSRPADDNFFSSYIKVSTWDNLPIDLYYLGLVPGQNWISAFNAGNSNLQLHWGKWSVWSPITYGSSNYTCGTNPARWCGNTDLINETYSEHVNFVTCNGNNGSCPNWRVGWSLNGTFISLSKSGNIYITVQSPYQVPTATPTPNTSYCASIEGQGAGAQPDPGLSWSGVYLGTNTCVDLGGWDFSILGIDVSVPLIRVCMQDVSFANVVLFGMSFSLDAIAYVLGGAWVIKRLITS